MGKAAAFLKEESIKTPFFTYIKFYLRVTDY